MRVTNEEHLQFKAIASDNGKTLDHLYFLELSRVLIVKELLNVIVSREVVVEEIQEILDLFMISVSNLRLSNKLSWEEHFKQSK